MNKLHRPKQILSGDNLIFVKQEFDDENENLKPPHHESSSSTPCTSASTSAIKCEYDTDCGCPQCRFNVNTKVKTEEQQIKFEDDHDNKVNSSATQFWLKCVKKEDEDDCGCEECRGVEDSKQSNREVKVKSEVNFTETVEQGTIRDYRRWSDRVANKPKITYKYQEESSASGNDFEPPHDDKNEDDGTELEDNVEIIENTSRASKSKQPREITLKNQTNKKFKSRHLNGQIDENSSDEDTESESEIETTSVNAKKSKQSTKPKSSYSDDCTTSENSSDEEDNEEPRKNKRFERRVLIVRLNCSECDETFKSVHKLHQHLKSSHQIKFYRCLVRDCVASFNLKPQITHHLRTEHSILSNNLSCGECDLKFTNHRQLDKHYSRTHQKGHFKCTFKGCRFESRLYRNSILNHYKAKHVEAIFECQVKGCAKSFPEQNRLQNHVRRAHTDEKKFQCELCESAYSDKVSLRVHLAKVHQVGQLSQYKCTWPKCKWSSIHRANVIRHVRENHLKKGDPRVPKDFISKIETTKMTVDKNEDNSKAFVTIRLNCLVVDCVEHFPDKRQLNFHLSKCHQIEEFRCLVRGCSASFKNKNHFAAHKKEVHHKQKVLQCGMCDYVTQIYMHLRSHVYFCHEEGHFGCVLPGCRFVSRTTRNDLSKHRFKHR